MFRQENLSFTFFVAAAPVALVHEPSDHSYYSMGLLVIPFFHKSNYCLVPN